VLSKLIMYLRTIPITSVHSFYSHPSPSISNSNDYYQDSALKLILTSIDESQLNQYKQITSSSFAWRWIFSWPL